MISVWASYFTIFTSRRPHFKFKCRDTCGYKFGKHCISSGLCEQLTVLAHICTEHYIETSWRTVLPLMFLLLMLLQFFKCIFLVISWCLKKSLFIVTSRWNFMHVILKFILRRSSFSTVLICGLFHSPLHRFFIIGNTYSTRIGVSKRFNVRPHTTVLNMSQGR
jgi:hypothetical protein